MHSGSKELFVGTNGRIFPFTHLEQLHHSLTAALPLAGTRQLGDGGQTIQELRAESAFTNALRVPIYDTYRWPLRDGLTAVPELDRDALAEWIRGEFTTPAGIARTGSLADTLERHFTQAFNVGGTLALELLTSASSAGAGSGLAFNLRDEALLETIAETAVSYTDPFARVSLTNTTANDLARQIAGGRADGLTEGALNGLLNIYISGRVLQRTGNIAAAEVVSWSRKGLGTTYARNDVEYMIYKTAGAPCPICAPYEGQRMRASNGRVWFDLLPQHPNCNCYYLPDVAGWELPEEVWAG
jgi:hypothetical protein